nr:hypothetical protein [Zea mays]
MLERSARTGGIFRNCRVYMDALRFRWAADSHIRQSGLGTAIAIAHSKGWKYLWIESDSTYVVFLLILISQWHLGKLLTLAVTNSWPIRQLDVNNAFLAGFFNSCSIHGTTTWVFRLFDSCLCLQVALAYLWPSALVLG